MSSIITKEKITCSNILNARQGTGYLRILAKNDIVDLNNNNNSIAIT